jgi:hypothetical protein
MKWNYSQTTTGLFHLAKRTRTACGEVAEVEGVSGIVERGFAQAWLADNPADLCLHCRRKTARSN